MVEEALLHLWDFGGQDLYHGTHALFMRTRSLFILVWTPQSENTREYEYGGMTFRNHPLAYWLEYLRHLSGMDSPVLIVQNMCDRPEDEVLDRPFRMRRCRFSASARCCTTVHGRTAGAVHSTTHSSKRSSGSGRRWARLGSARDEWRSSGSWRP